MTKKFYGTESFMSNPPRPGALCEIVDSGKSKVICYYKDTDYEQAKFIEDRMNNYERLLEFVKTISEVDDDSFYWNFDAQELLKEIGEL